MGLLQYLIDKAKIIITILLLLGLIDMTIMKSKWQYTPFYIAGFTYILIVILNNLEWIELSSKLSNGIIVVMIVLLLLPFGLVKAFPTEKLPVPSGKYQIGTKIFDLTDYSRNEIYGDNLSKNRKIKYQVWYPTDDTYGYKKAKWISDGKLLTRKVASNMRLPAFILDHTASIDSNSYLNAPVNNSLDKYPLVVISHGWKGFREIHTDYAEELASNGYIVVSIDHTYGSQAVKFNDGKVAYLNKKALPRIAKATEYARISNLLEVTYGEDVASVLDDLERVNRTDTILKGKIDLDKIGTLGHSTGGAGAVYIALKDNRIKALMGLDAWLKPIASEIKGGLIIPSLFLRSEQWSKGPNNISLYHLLNLSDHASLVELSKTNHVDFSMSYMYSPITKYIGFTGKLGGRVSSEIQRKLILSFFDHNLKNNSQSNEDYLLDILNKEDNLSMVDRW